MKQIHTKQSRATQDPFCNVTTEATQPYSFHFIFQVILLRLHSSFCYKIHIYTTRDTMYEPNQRTFVHSSRTRWRARRDLESFARLASFRGPSKKGDSVCPLTIPWTESLHYVICITSALQTRTSIKICLFVWWNFQVKKNLLSSPSISYIICLPYS